MNIHKQLLNSTSALPDSAPGRQHIKRMLKSPGTCFMVASALLNAANQPLMMITYAIGLLTQLGAQRLCASGQTNSKLLTFLGGEQGGLAINAGLTFSCGLTMCALGTAPLALACTLLAFGIANAGQSFIRGGILKLEDRPKDIALTACDAVMGIGFFLLGKHIDMPSVPLIASTLTNAIMIACRAFLGNKIPSDVVYGEMMANAATTFAYSGNLQQYDIAASRAMALIAISRIAAERAQDRGERSYLDISRLPEATRYIKSILAKKLLA